MYLELTLDRPENGPQKDYGTTNGPAGTFPKNRPETIGTQTNPKRTF